jgi:hypothetical protein
MEGGDGRESRNWVNDGDDRSTGATRADLAAHSSALAALTIATRHPTRGRYPIVPLILSPPHSYGNSRDVPHVDSGRGNT